MWAQCAVAFGGTGPDEVKERWNPAVSPASRGTGAVCVLPSGGLSLDTVNPSVSQAFPQVFVPDKKKF